MNLQRIKATRSAPQAGDIFAMRLPDGRHLFGRVILADRPRESAPMPKANLIYVYDHVSEEISHPDELSTAGLLLPPIFTNNLPWSKGYFFKVAHATLREDDLLKRHCFQRWTGECLDEAGNRLDGPLEPCGEWVLMSYRMIDDLISDAMGIPRASA